MVQKNRISVNGAEFLMRLIFILLFIIVTVLAASLLINGVHSQITNPELKNNEMSINELMREREKSLIKNLRNKNYRKSSPEKVFDALKQIGDLKRAGMISGDDAIPYLVDLLDFEKVLAKNRSSDYIDEYPRAPTDIYPAIDTLLIIGEPAVPFLIEAIALHDLNSVGLSNAVYTIRYIHREDLAKGLAALRNAQSKAISEARSNRIEREIEKYSWNPQ